MNHKEIIKNCTYLYDNKYDNSQDTPFSIAGERIMSIKYTAKSREIQDCNNYYISEYCSEDTANLMNLAYQQGYEDGKIQACEQANIAISKAYEKGMKDAIQEKE